MNHGSWEQQIGPYTTIYQNNRWVKSTVRDEKHAFHVEVWKQGALPMEPLTVILCFQKDLHQISTGPTARPQALSLSKLCMVINLLWTLQVWLLQRFLIACVIATDEQRNSLVLWESLNTKKLSSLQHEKQAPSHLHFPNCAAFVYVQCCIGCHHQAALYHQSQQRKNLPSKHRKACYCISLLLLLEVKSDSSVAQQVQ